MRHLLTYERRREQPKREITREAVVNGHSADRTLLPSAPIAAKEKAMARSCACKTCGRTIRPKAKKMSLGSAVRIHYWREHPEIMRGKPARKIKTRAKTA